ncbi:MAG: NADH-quinone oxidoreductase subunit NuoF [Candidatus Zixiibacteriota bacterium]|nr:MAG: NADH-quinone oxidoreductase subunit NuoF [candidate division Zixibacteria bacterium]
MQSVKSAEEFLDLRKRIITDRDLKIPTIVISAGTCGQASGANDLIRVAKRELLFKSLTERIHLRITGCHGFCEIEPSVLIEPRGTIYPKVGINEMVRIIEGIDQGRVVEDLLYTNPATGQKIEKQADLPFYKRQTRTILSQNEKIDPIRTYNYIENNGYLALVRVLQKSDSKWIIEEIKASGLRGRGGAGFPTGLKWEFLANQCDSGEKYLVCNADEGDPGAYMDRSILEGNPHSVIEGMIIGAYATGATKGIIYVRNEYPLAIKHLVIALRQARELGVLGDNILGSGFSFDIELVRGAGAFVCGEETALIRSIEGKMGEPRQRPPFPVQKGINGNPTAINNVESWANIPVIIRDTARKYSKIGTKGNSGTKIFSLVGKIKNTGLVEVPLGIKISEVIYDIGGGPVGDAKIKAVQTGGPSGGCIPASMFDLSIDYDSLTKAGSIMGSGGMIVMDENTCMVDVAKYFMNFLKDESCGKCFTCRKGTQRMYEILDDITKGNAGMEDLDLLEELASVVKDTTMCGLGHGASNPVLSTLRYFRSEYIRHIVDKRCDAYVCKDLVGAPCQSACPVGTEPWRYIAHLARGEYEEAYRVIRETNPFPSICARVCDHNCENRCKLGTTGSKPVAVRALKRFIADRVDPASYRPVRQPTAENESKKVAVVGSGPAGLTTAHYLSLKGYKVTIFEADKEPGGMLLAGIPEYRLPRNVLRKEIECLLDENINVKCETTLGKDFTADDLFKDGFGAVFLALGAHHSKSMGIEGENADGIYPSINFLREFNFKGQNLAKGHVGIIGGGNSAIDAARVALRQSDVESVTIFYRRSRKEMPAFQMEIDAALEEGVNLQTLVSPTGIISENGRLSKVEFIRNELGKPDASGRRSFREIPGSEFSAPLDTLIVAIGEQMYPYALDGSSGIETVRGGAIAIDENNLSTKREGVFAGGDVVTGPNSVINAIATGKKAAHIIDCYLNERPMIIPAEKRLPEVYVEPVAVSPEDQGSADRIEPPNLPVEERKRTFAEIELCYSVEDARCEARRCLRCDLEFTQPEVEEDDYVKVGENKA